jgi:nitroreductase
MKFNLSEINDLIKSRRTIYPENYSTRKVHKEQIENILNNGQWAPNHGNTQPWKFIVFQENARQRLADTLGEMYLKLTPKEMQKDHKLAKMITRPLQSTVVIAVCLNREEDSKIAEIEEIEAVACAVQNMHLTATAYGLGAFWSTPKIIYTEEFTAFLNLKSPQKWLGLFYIGYPTDEWPKGHRRPLEYNSEWLSE